jgi:enoyl-CoA hydratase
MFNQRQAAQRKGIGGILPNDAERTLPDIPEGVVTFKLIGLSRASEILYTGRKVFGEEAEKIGLVSKLASSENLIETALSYARMMLEKNPGGLKQTKKVLEQNNTASSLEAAINLENRNQVILIFSGEFYSRIQSFFGGK